METNPVDYKTPNSIAAIWSMMLPGLGQMMKGQIMPGIIWAVVVSSGYFSFMWPGIIAHAFCILDAGFSGDKESWQKKLSLGATVAGLLFYIVFRNTY
jgi:TM2 domain-containing membrane protein YozV